MDRGAHLRRPRAILLGLAAAWIVLGSLAAWAGYTDALPSFRRWSQPAEGHRPAPPARGPLLDTGS